MSIFHPCIATIGKTTTGCNFKVCNPSYRIHLPRDKTVQKQFKTQEEEEDIPCSIDSQQWAIQRARLSLVRGLIAQSILALDKAIKYP